MDRGRTRPVVSLLVATVVLGGFTLAPVSAHFTQDTRHLGKHAWQQVIKEKVTALAPRAYGSAAVNGVSFSEPTFVNILRRPVTAPRKGYLHIVAHVMSNDNGSVTGPGLLHYRLTVDGVTVGTEYFMAYGGSPGTIEIGGASAIVKVGKGDHMVALQGKEVGSGSVIDDRDLSVLFVPFGSTTLPVSAP
ncbi:MAG TPA: hypothetical protein VF058_02525 [Actinomycetota bacterium]